MALKIAQFYRLNKRAAIVLVAPAILALLPILLPIPEARCAYVLLLMAVYLCAEVVPIAITGLLPMLLIPLFGIMTSDKVAACYMKDLMMLFFCSVSLAALMEKTNLHKRIALNTMRFVGLEPSRLLTGFMIVTWFFSMWMSNAATVAMILPVIDALVHQRFKEIRDKRESAIYRSVTIEMSESSAKLEPYCSLDSGLSDSAVELPSSRSDTELCKKMQLGQTESKAPASLVNEDSYIREMKAAKNVQKMLILAVAYTAACGGMVTITGSSTNLVLVGQLSEYPGHGLNFASWFIIAFPISVITMLFSWVWLAYYFCGVDGIRTTFQGRKPGQKKTESEQFIEDECKRLGEFRYEEGCTVFFFVLLVLLWMTRDIGGVGWGHLFKTDRRGNPYVTDSQAGLVVVCLCVIVPSLTWVDSHEQKTKKSKDEFEIEEDKSKSTVSRYLLTWSDINKTVPWDIMFLIGGGIAISEACKASGLSAWFGSQLDFLRHTPPFTVLIFVVVLSMFLTQFISNQAVCSIMLPVLLDMAQSLGVNPLYFMFPTSLASSLAFILPIASTSNAIAFASGHITTGDMVKTGSVVNLIGLLVLLACVFTYGTSYILDPELNWGGIKLKHVLNAATNLTSNSTALPVTAGTTLAVSNSTA